MNEDRNTRLVAVSVRHHDLVPVGVCFKDWADGSVQDGIKQHDVFVILEGAKSYEGSTFNITRSINDDINLRCIA